MITADDHCSPLIYRVSCRFAGRGRSFGARHEVSKWYLSFESSRHIPRSRR